MLWLVSTAISNVHVVMIRVWVRTIIQLATPTYRERKKKEKTVVASSPAPTLVDPSHVSVLCKVEGGKAVKPETTPAAKKSKRSESP